jgi:hypothetical protein
MLLVLEEERSNRGELVQGRAVESTLALIPSFIFVINNDTPYSSGLIQFLAVINIDITTRRLRTAKNFPTILQALCTV